MIAPGQQPLVRDLISFALMRINVLQPGQDASTDQLEDSFNFLNLMVDDWQTQRLTMPYTQVVEFAFTSTKGTPSNPYIVGLGTGTDIPMIRPVYIDHITYKDLSLTVPLERPLTPLSDDAYAAIPLKTLTSPLPGAWWYQPHYEDFNGHLYFWMIPTQANLHGVVYAPSPIPQFSSYDTKVILPPSYTFALTENLAVLLSATFRENVPPDPILVRNAAQTLENLKRANVRIMDLSIDPALTTRRGVYNIFSDSTTGRP